MFPRLVVFALAWIAALVFLPALWVGAAALLWLAVLTPGLVKIHRQFQNEPQPG